MRIRTVFLAVVAAVSLTACANTNGTGASPPSSSPTVTAPASTAAPTPSPTAKPSASGPNCATQTVGWKTETTLDAPNPVQAVVNKADAGQHDCFDQITFTFMKPHAQLRSVGYDVRYVDSVKSQGKGDTVFVSGKPLQVTIYDPSYCFPPGNTSDNPPRDPCWTTGQSLNAIGGVGPSIKEIKYAGSFERRTTFAVGVSGTLPFQVYIWDDAATDTTYMILMVAHP